ncbi:MAG: hypothetical protein WBL68_12615 [Nitrososphaeraceae archaeon]
MIGVTEVVHLVRREDKNQARRELAKPFNKKLVIAIDAAII